MKRTNRKPIRILMVGLAALTSWITPVSASEGDTGVSAKEAFELEGFIQYQLANCEMKEDSRIYANGLSQRAVTAIYWKFPTTPEVASEFIRNGAERARTSNSANPSDTRCSAEKTECLLSYLEEREQIVSKILGPRELASPQTWPAVRSACDDSDEPSSGGD